MSAESKATILATITKQRAMDIKAKGHSLGFSVPDSRIYPLIPPHITNNFTIAEIKRASPSAGDISAVNDIESTARAYLNGGANAISVLCEEHYFKGSLNDLMQVKSKFPNACILRKDFILEVKDIEISYLVGADMVLLITAVFMAQESGFETLSAIYSACEKYGITPLLEVHNSAELEFIAPLKPKLLGINARNLSDFSIDIIRACSLKRHIERDFNGAFSDSHIIFESGIDSSHSAFIIGANGFNGLLCGSYLVAHNNPSKAITALKNAMQKGMVCENAFYPKVFDRLVASQMLESKGAKPLLKVCGITNIDNALEIAALQSGGGVDMLGFIMVENSKRFIHTKQIKNISKALERLYPHILRVAVVNDKASLESAKALLNENIIHAIQLHSLDSSAKSFANIALESATFCYYGVQNIANSSDFRADFVGAFCLLDSKLGGGSGKSIDFNVLKTIKAQTPYLCVAGGINVENISEFLSLKPAMLDINSGVESSPGIKDIAKLEALLKDIES